MAKLTEDEKKKKRIEKKTKDFMNSAKEFLEAKNGGNLPPEWSCSLQMLEVWYRQFLMITDEIENMDSIIVESRYGPQPTALLGAQAQCSVRIEKALSDMGLTFKAAAKLNVVTPKEEESPLEQFMKGKVDIKKKKSNPVEER